MKTKKRLIINSILALAVIVPASLVWLSHGYLWSFREIRFRKLLNSLPEPPGWISETDLVDTSGYSPFGFRYYDVNSSYEDVIDFFRSEIPKLGLQPLHEEEYDPSPSSTKPGIYLQSTTLYFAYHRNECVSIHVLTTTNEDGIPVGDWTKINIMIADATEHPDCRRFVE